jgi:hypothetical protein
VYTTKVFARADNGHGQDDEIGRLARATDCLRRRSRTNAPATLRDELTRLRRIIDRIELEFSVVAGAFAATEEEEWQGCLSPPQWMRLECGMTSAAATNAIAVGSQGVALAESVAAVEEGRLSFAHLALMAGTARAFQASPTATPFEERALRDQAMSHTLSRFRTDCAHARHAHDAEAFQAEQLKDVEYRTLEVRTGEGGAVFIKGSSTRWVGRPCAPRSIRSRAELEATTIDRGIGATPTRSSNSPGTASMRRPYPGWVASVRTCR